MAAASLGLSAGVASICVGTAVACALKTSFSRGSDIAETLSSHAGFVNMLSSSSGSLVIQLVPELLSKICVALPANFTAAALGVMSQSDFDHDKDKNEKKAFIIGSLSGNIFSVSMLCSLSTGFLSGGMAVAGGALVAYKVAQYMTV